MVEIDNNSLIQTISIVALAVIAFSVGLQKLLKDWKSTNAETSVITLMHTELERMSQQNTLLATELNRLQQEMIILNTQNIFSNILRTVLATEMNRNIPYVNNRLNDFLFTFNIPIEFDISYNNTDVSNNG